MSVDLERLAASFDRVQAMGDAERAAYLEQLGRAEPELHRELQELLDADAREHALLDSAPELPPDWSADAARSEPLDLVGSVLGGFQVLSTLGAGSMAEVYEAEQATPRRRVALKVLRWSRVGDAAARRFAAEAQALAELDHPSIASIFGAGEESIDGQCLSWIAMELVPQPLPISTYCESASLPTGARLALFVRVCDAVHHAHRCGFLHRDLKPANVVVSGAPRQRAHDQVDVKVIAFGIARLLSGSRAELTRQCDGELIGTVLYMSPQQAEGRIAGGDVRSDVYALGVMLFELLRSGGHPLLHGDESMLQALSRIRSSTAADVRAAVAGLPDDLAAIVARSLQPDPDQRYDGVDELRDDLRRYLACEPVVARRSSLGHRLVLFARRRTALCAGVAAAFAVFAAGLIAIVVLYVKADAAVADYRAAEAQSQERAARLRTAKVDLNDVRDRLALVAETMTAELIRQSAEKVQRTVGLDQRRLAVKEAFAKLEELRGTLVDDAASRKTLIAAYRRVGDLHGSEWFAAPEDATVGHEAFVQAVDLARRHAALRAGPEARRLLAGSLVDYVHSCRKTGKVRLGAAAADELVSLAHARCAESDAGDLSVEADLVAAYWTRCDFRYSHPESGQLFASSIAAGASRSGLADAEAALAVAERGRADPAANPARWRRLWGWSHFRVGAWLKYDPVRSQECGPHLQKCADAALQTYADGPTTRRRQDLRTQLGLELQHLAEVDRGRAARRAQQGMEQIAARELDSELYDASALVEWTQFAAVRLACVDGDLRSACADEVERRWSAVAPEEYRRMSDRLYVAAMELLGAGLGDRRGLASLYRSALRDAEAKAASRSDGPRLLAELRAAMGL
ncbi:MAG: protein kinase [Planctomycetota bacterium]